METYQPQKESVFLTLNLVSVTHDQVLVLLLNREIPIIQSRTPFGISDQLGILHLNEDPGEVYREPPSYQ